MFMDTGGLRRPEASLDDRFAASDGRALISGVQALVRVTLDQRRLDDERGLDTRVVVSGYQGSPLGVLDREFARAARHTDPAGVVFAPGLNEELAATAVAGTQLLGELAGRRHEGVTGVWYGKSPGVDRAADAIRHGNVSGTAPLGGAVAWIGDDPTAKSSTVPSACEPMCRSLLMPLLAPVDVQDVLALGLHAIALSRHAGLWSALKIVADVADASATVELGVASRSIPSLAAREGFVPATLLGRHAVAAEDELMTLRLARAGEYARAAGLNRIAFAPDRSRVAVVAAGLAFSAVVRALDDLGLDEPALDALGIRLVRLGMPWPLDAATVGSLTAGCETVLVVEDKLAFVETAVKEALYGAPSAPAVLGKHDLDGRPLLPSRGALHADDVALALGRVLGEGRLPERAQARIERLRTVAAPGAAGPEALPLRTPAFCSGCPHNTSTRAEPDQLVGVGIGCHTMVALEAGDRRGTLVGMPQMGGEGAQWIGLAPFCDEPHLIQNLGDGTFHHSGSLAIRAAVAAGVSMTYRLLYNDAVAMTGGQTPEGQLAVPDIARLLEIEGVRQVVITTPEPERYRRVDLPAATSVRHRDDLPDVQRELAAVEGVTAIVHDDACATEKRRRRKRGELPTPAERVWINERVCEGCGDCGEKSSCLSVLPVETEFGRKTQIHQGSCNFDMTCVKGDCPSFVLVTPGDQEPRSSQPPVPPVPPVTPPDPVLRVGREVLVRMPGVGGTGVVTVSQILQMAAHLDGRFAAGLEQIGLAQKGGPVLSDIRISDRPIAGELRAGPGRADVLLGLDLLGAAAPETLAVSDPERTVAVLDTARQATAAMVTDTKVVFGPASRPLGRIRAVTRRSEEMCLDAQALSERLFGDHMPANTIMLGAAFQHGCLPVSAAALQRAIEFNGGDVARNLAAFAWGRAAAFDSVAVEAALAPVAPERPGPSARALALVEERLAGVRPAVSSPSGELRDALLLRCDELLAFGGERCARAYVEEVARVAALAGVRAPADGAERVALAYARGLFKLTAYKDEYEVARLHLDALETRRRDDAFGAEAKAELLLHPPLLRTLGLRRKLRLGRSGFAGMRALRAARGLRGTPLDPFGRTEVRRTERALPGEYRQLVAAALEHLDGRTVDRVVEIAELPDVVRGYEEIKLRGVAEFRLRARALSEQLARGGVREAALPALPLVRVGGAR